MGTFVVSINAISEKIKEERVNFQDGNTPYKFLSKFYDLFDLIFLLGQKGNPRSGLLEVIDNTSQTILDVCVGTVARFLLISTHHDQN